MSNFPLYTIKLNGDRVVVTDDLGKVVYTVGGRKVRTVKDAERVFRLSRGQVGYLMAYKKLDIYRAVGASDVHSGAYAFSGVKK